VIDLRVVPAGEAEVARLYHELGRLGGRAEGRQAPWRFEGAEPEEVVVLAAQAARREPRLLWVVVELLTAGYQRLNPLLLRRAVRRCRWPGAVGVALEFARLASRTEELDAVAAFVLQGVAPASGERFFLGTRAFAGPLARRDAEESLAEYRRWGYFSREVPLAKELGAASRGTLGPAERRNLLRRLAGRADGVTLADYLAALGGRASPRQASRDLAGAAFLARTGRTRAASYRLLSCRVPR
jgi:hypothetical protein